MRVYAGLDAVLGLDLLQSGPPGVEGHSVVAVGVYDGVHLGHQKLLHELLLMSARLGGVPTVVTFRSHPDTLLKGNAPPLLVSVPHRLRLLRRAGVQRTALLDFDDRLRQTSAETFARNVLHRALNTRGLLLGFDSAMGRNREGTPERFAELGRDLDFEVAVGAPLDVDGETVSSTKIRAAIAGGDLDTAYRFLGRWPSVFGPVVHGDGRGRTLGFPTANVVPESAAIPPDGVYAVEVIRGGDTLPGVAHLGQRPTFDDAPDRGWRSTCSDFEGDLYGEDLEVSFLKNLRGARRFHNPAELEAQIRRDIEAARAALG